MFKKYHKKSITTKNTSVNALTQLHTNLISCLKRQSKVIGT